MHTVAFARSVIKFISNDFMISMEVKEKRRKAVFIASFASQQLFQVQEHIFYIHELIRMFDI